MLNRSLAPESRAIDNIQFIAPIKQTLDNGIPVFTVNAGTQDLVRIEFIFQNVNWDPAKPLQATSTSHLLNNGTSDLSAREIADRVDYYGAFLQTEYGADQSSVKVYTLNKHLTAVLPVVWSILNDSIFPEQELLTFKQNQQQSLKVSLQKNDFLARKSFANAIFGHSTYGADLSEEDYAGIQQLDLQAYYSAAYQPDNCTMFVAGKFEEAEFLILNSIFGKTWTNNGKGSVNNFTFDPPKKYELLIERPDSLQSAIRMGKVTINRTHPDFASFQVMNCLLGGYFGSRLMANIREDKGYTYGINSAIVSLKDAGYFFIATEVGVDVCKNTLDEIHKEIDLLKTEDVSNEELDLVRNYMLGSMLGSLENAFSHADKFKNIYFSGLSYDYYEQYIHTVKTIQPEDIKLLANKYLDTQNFAQVIAGKQ